MDSRTNCGWTPLLYAACGGHLACLLTLLDAGADAGSRSFDQRTALHYSAQQGHAECTRALLDCGADRDATDRAGDSALYLAKVSGRREVVALLLSHGATPPLGVTFSPALLGAALEAARGLLRELGPPAVEAERAEAEAAVAEEAGPRGGKPHARLRAVLQLAAAAAPKRAAAARPAAGSPEQQQQQDPQEPPLGRHAAAAAAARARFREECAADAEGDAAQRCVALLESLPRGMLRSLGGGDDAPQAGPSGCCDVAGHQGPEPAGRRHRAAEGSGGELREAEQRSEAKALYAAAVCVGRWGQAKAALAEARRDAAAAQGALDAARADAAAVVHRLETALALAAEAAARAAAEAAAAEAAAAAAGATVATPTQEQGDDESPAVSGLLGADDRSIARDGGGGFVGAEPLGGPAAGSQVAAAAGAGGGDLLSLPPPPPPVRLFITTTRSRRAL